MYLITNLITSTARYCKCKSQLLVPFLIYDETNILTLHLLLSQFSSALAAPDTLLNLT